MPPENLLLAFDTSAAHCAVALLLGNRVLAARSEEMNKGQAERLFPMLQEMLADCDKTWADLSAIGVGIGPGNFTGIRLSVSAARGLALSLKVPAIGVSMLEALRFGHEGIVLATLDARRDQLYVQSSAEEPARVIPIGNLNDQITTKIDLCVGHKAPEIAERLNAQVSAPKFPTEVAIARIASSRLGQENPRPAPMYLKAPDAAPSRDSAPVILE